MAEQVVQAPVPVQAPAAQAAGHVMQVLVPSQTRGAVQQSEAPVHVRQLLAVVSQVEHEPVHAVQVPPLKAYPEEQQLDAVGQVRQSPVPVHEPATQAAGHAMQLVLPSQTRGAVQQLLAVGQVRQEVPLSHVAHVAGQSTQLTPPSKYRAPVQQFVPDVGQIRQPSTSQVKQVPLHA